MGSAGVASGAPPDRYERSDDATQAQGGWYELSYTHEGPQPVGLLARRSERRQEDQGPVLPWGKDPGPARTTPRRGPPSPGRERPRRNAPTMASDSSSPVPTPSDIVQVLQVEGSHPKPLSTLLHLPTTSRLERSIERYHRRESAELYAG